MGHRPLRPRDVPAIPLASPLDDLARANVTDARANVTDARANVTDLRGSVLVGKRC
jgi:hypothetical protein